MTGNIIYDSSFGTILSIGMSVTDVRCFCCVLNDRQDLDSVNRTFIVLIPKIAQSKHVTYATSTSSIPR